jgi:hypothetical protein
MKTMTRNYFHAIAFLGGILLLDIAVHLLRQPVGFARWDYVEPVFRAGSIVVIWLLKKGLRAQPDYTEILRKKWGSSDPDGEE